MIESDAEVCFAVFQDLGSSDLRKDVYIVVHIIRIGGSYVAASLFY